MWGSKSENVADRGILKLTITRDSLPVSYREILRHWRSDAKFRSFFNALLSNCHFTAFRWETPAITIHTAQRQFEFVLLDSPELIRKPDPDTFADHFNSASPEESVIEFSNLGGDAILVVPCPKSETSSYGHIASFVRTAPEMQRHALWEAVGAAMERRLNAKPVWLSTAGAGVSWLHVRLDNRSKYYGYAPYRSGI
jgi:hypothetical protein